MVIIPSVTSRYRPDMTWNALKGTLNPIQKNNIQQSSTLLYKTDSVQTNVFFFWSIKQFASQSINPCKLLMTLSIKINQIVNSACLAILLRYCVTTIGYQTMNIDVVIISILTPKYYNVILPMCSKYPPIFCKFLGNLIL